MSLASSTHIALSWSRLSDYRQCPLKFKLKYLDKNPSFKEDESASPHLVRGSNVHKQLENYIIKRKDGIARADIQQSTLPEVENGRDIVERMFTMYQEILPEAQVANNRDWKQVEWFDRSAFYRAIFDMIGLNPTNVLIGDFKTGKFKDYSAERPGQLELSTAIAFNIWPNVERVDTAYFYVDHRKSIPRGYTRDEAIKFTQLFTEEHDQVNSDTKFNPTQNEFCKYCPATKVMCRYSRKL